MTMSARIFAAIAFLAILSGCSSIRTDNPVGVSGGAQTDAKLIGGWRLVGWGGAKQMIRPSGASYLFFIPRKEGGYTGVSLGWDTQNPSNSGVDLIRVITGRIGVEGMISFKILSENGKPSQDSERGYWPLLYRIEQDGRLHIYFASDDGLKLVESAVQSHRLAGTSNEQEYQAGASGKKTKVIHVHITANPKSLDAFFTAEAHLIFTEPTATFERIK